jgi:hypothetical protein
VHPSWEGGSELSVAKTGKQDYPCRAGSRGLMRAATASKRCELAPDTVQIKPPFGAIFLARPAPVKWSRCRWRFAGKT